MRDEQPPLPGFPLPCGWNECGKDAVCALYRKDVPDLIVNTCRECFREVTGREFTPEEIGELAGVSA